MRIIGSVVAVTIIGTMMPLHIQDGASNDVLAFEDVCILLDGVAAEYRKELRKCSLAKIAEVGSNDHLFYYKGAALELSGNN